MLEGILGALVVILGIFLIRARQHRQLDSSLLQAREQTEARLLEEKSYYKELFELGDASYKESQERIQSLLGAVNATTLILEGDLMGEAVVWLRVLGAFDIIFFVICIWIFPIALEE